MNSTSTYSEFSFLAIVPERHIAPPAPSLSKPFEIGDNIFVKLERVISASKYICSVPNGAIANGKSLPFANGAINEHRYIKSIGNFETYDVPRKRRRKEAILDKLPHLRTLKYFDLLLIDRVKSPKALLSKQVKPKAKVDPKHAEGSANGRELESKTSRKRSIKALEEKDSILNDESKTNGRVQIRDVNVRESIPLAIYKVTSHGSGLKMRMQRKRTSSDGSTANSEQYDDSWDSDPTSTESSDSSSSRESSTASSEKSWYSSRSRRIPRRRCPCCR